METKNLIAKLHPLERRILPLLKTNPAFHQLKKHSPLSEVEIMRALEWLENKKIISLKKEKKEIIDLTAKGEKYLKTGLPERKFLFALKGSHLTLKEIKNIAVLDDQELNAALGWLKRKLAITFSKGLVALKEEGKSLLEKQTREEAFLRKNFPFGKEQLLPEEEEIFQELKKRNILEEKKITDWQILLTGLGEELIKEKIEEKVLGRLTSQMIKTKEWQKVPLRAYDIKINVPRIYPGKEHFVTQAINYAKRIWIEMGFKEITGPLIQTSFWNFDALFVPQDHPARELQDTFFVSPEKGRLPELSLVEKVKKIHQTGGWGSKGWRYFWDKEESKKNVLRTHTTVLSAKALYQIRKDLKNHLPAKYFALGKCFRNEALDWNHLFEFNQTEGIVVDEKVNFRHLLGYLKEFFKKMGFEKAKFRPAYFPYTEPSVEIEVFHPLHQQWYELGGAGIFRPEVVIPLLGKDIPVLAWGPGFDRLIMDYYQLTDIRELYRNDLGKLREIKFWWK